MQISAAVEPRHETHRICFIPSHICRVTLYHTPRLIPRKQMEPFCSDTGTGAQPCIDNPYFTWLFHDVNRSACFLPSFLENLLADQMFHCMTSCDPWCLIIEGIDWLVRRRVYHWFSLCFALRTHALCIIALILCSLPHSFISPILQDLYYARLCELSGFHQ